MLLPAAVQIVPGRREVSTGVTDSEESRLVVPPVLRDRTDGKAVLVLRDRPEPGAWSWELGFLAVAPDDQGVGAVGEVLCRASSAGPRCAIPLHSDLGDHQLGGLREGPAARGGLSADGAMVRARVYVDGPGVAVRVVPCWWTMSRLGLGTNGSR